MKNQRLEPIVERMRYGLEYKLVLGGGLSGGGYVEMKNGQLCLRVADVMCQRTDGITVERRWLPGEWSLLYPLRRPA